MRSAAHLWVLVILIAQHGAYGQRVTARVVRSSQASNDIATRAVIGPDRRIYAIDASAGTVVVFDSTGSPVDTIRARGERRFDGAYAIGFRADTFWVSDASSRLVSMYDQDRLIRIFRNTAKAPTSETYYEIVGLAPGGQVWLDESGSLSAAGAMMRNGRAVALAPRGDTTVHVVARVAARHIALTLKMPRDRVFLAAQPWASTDIYALSASSDAMVLVKRFDTHGHAADSTIVQSFDGAGRLVWQRAIRLPRVAVTEALLATAVEAVANPAVLAAYGDSAAARRAVREVLYAPDSLPAISRVVVSDRGQIWLGHTASTDTRLWSVLNSDGSNAEIVEIPADIRVEDVSGGWIVGVRIDKRNRTQLVRLAIQ